MLYRYRPTPLHAARAGIGALWCAAATACVLLAPGPLLLAVLGAGLLAACALAGCLRSALRMMAFALPWAIAFVVINAVVARQGLTVIWRFGDLGPFGQGDVTLESVVYGVVFGLRLIVLLLPTVLFATAVNPDDLLRLAGRWSLRSALAATLATRLVPTLAADARRIDEARRCRARAPRGGRLAVVRAVTGGALERALDVAATLELRGFSGAVGGRRRSIPTPWSRQDVAFAASAVGLVAAIALVRAFGLVRFSAYPEISVGTAAAAPLAGIAIVAVLLAPFLATRGAGR